MVEKPLDGSPKRATAATWSAAEAGSALVARSITVEPCEYPPSTIREFGQLDTVSWMWVAASSAPAFALLW